MLLSARTQLIKLLFNDSRNQNPSIYYPYFSVLINSGQLGLRIYVVFPLTSASADTPCLGHTNRRFRSILDDPIRRRQNRHTPKRTLNRCHSIHSMQPKRFYYSVVNHKFTRLATIDQPPRLLRSQRERARACVHSRRSGRNRCACMRIHKSRPKIRALLLTD